MGREKVKLTVEKRAAGVRYRRMFKGAVWTSNTYPHESRENKREAWQEYVEWRAGRAARSPEPQPGDPYALLRELCHHKFQAMIDFAELTGDPEDAKAWRFVQGSVQTANPGMLKMLTAFAAGEVNGVDVGEVVRDRERVVARLNERPAAELAARVLADEHVAAVKRKADTDRGSHGYHGQVKAALDVFVNWYGAIRSMAHLSEKVVRDYTTFLEKQIEDGRMSRNTVHGYQQVFRGFVEATAETYPADVTRPANLRSKKCLIRRERKEPRKFTPDEVRLLLDNAVPRTRLFLLLMLNCAMYQGDIADLQAGEVDWTAGRIVRARSKTRRHAKSVGRGQPVRANWLLWRTTWGLLKEFGHREGTVLRTEQGGDLITHKETTRNDAVRSAYSRLVAKLKKRKKLPADWNKTLKDFRKTGANLLEKSEEHGQFYTLYLNHSVAKQNYLQSGEPVPGFDAAVRWLGGRVGIE